jgi:vacuolar-type H+-ATPase subunit C/Vma6
MTELAQDLPDAGERAYVYAKACGIIGKSFVGTRTAALGTLRSPGDLDRLLFPEEHHELLGRELLVDLEKHIEKRAVDQILSIIKSYTNPPELFIRQIRLYEYSDLKACIHHIASGIDTLPSLCDIGRYGTINFEAFPDIAAMLKGTEFAFILSRDLKALQPDSEDFTPIETELDARYYLGLAKSLDQLPGEDRDVVQRLLADEISLRNCVWALRLRTYFKKSAAETGEHLMNIRMRGDSARDLTSAAWSSLYLPLDSRAQWQGWKWERFLNPDKSGEHWSLNPRHFQNAASQYLYRLANNRFHSAPGELSKIFCFIKIKQFEEDLLTSIAEGLGMGMNSADVFELLEVTA